MTKSQTSLINALKEHENKPRTVCLILMGFVQVIMRNILIDEDEGLLYAENVSPWPDLKDPSAERLEPAKRFVTRLDLIGGFWD